MERLARCLKDIFEKDVVLSDANTNHDVAHVYYASVADICNPASSLISRGRASCTCDVTCAIT
jgi:hypothetical protein